MTSQPSRDCWTFHISSLSFSPEGSRTVCCPDTPVSHGANGFYGNYLDCILVVFAETSVSCKKTMAVSCVTALTVPGQEHSLAMVRSVLPHFQAPSHSALVHCWRVFSSLPGLTVSPSHLAFAHFLSRPVSSLFVLLAPVFFCLSGETSSFPLAPLMLLEHEMRFLMYSTLHVTCYNSGEKHGDVWLCLCGGLLQQERICVAGVAEQELFRSCILFIFYLDVLPFRHCWCKCFSDPTPVGPCCERGLTDPPTRSHLHI